jgi:CheY-like chemotaxis protein
MTQMDDILSEALSYTRTLVAELSPTVLHEHGLAAGLHWLADYMKKHDMTVSVEMSTYEDVRLPEDQSVLLFQSVRELLINASKHAGTGQAVVTLEHQDDQLRIAVSDKGEGFDPVAVMAAAAADGGPKEGMSLKFGLFSIRERMKALGGSFELETAPGKGTTALLTLPLSRDNVQSAGPENQFSELPGQLIKASFMHHVDSIKSVKQPQRNIVRLLLVDDHAMVRQGLRALLESYGDIQVVGEACDGQEAVELTERLKPSVVVMDINMPEMNGIEATAKIKSRHPHTVIIGMSVNAAGENQNAMKTAGASRLLTKEAAVEHLHTAIQDSLKTLA